MTCSFQTAKESAESAVERLQHESDYECVLQELAQHTKNNNCKGCEPVNLQDRLKTYAEEREKRIERFLNHVQNKRHTYINNMLDKYRNSTPVCS